MSESLVDDCDVEETVSRSVRGGEPGTWWKWWRWRIILRRRLTVVVLDVLDLACVRIYVHSFVLK